MNDHWILDKDGTPVPADLMTWAKWFEASRRERIVKQEVINGLKVSTVFLGLDHNWGDGPPILWETMVFDQTGDHPWMDQDMDRCSGNREQAEAMHQRMVAKIKANETDQPS